MWLVIALGVVAGLYTLWRIDYAALGLRFVLLGGLTLVFGSRVVVRIPRSLGSISVADTFMFLSLLLFNGDAAVILAAGDAFCTSLRVTKKKLTIGFNVAVYICSTFLTVWTLRLLLGDIAGLSSPGYHSRYLVAICLMALVQYVANSGMVAAGVAFKMGQPFWPMWRQNFLWTSITYFAGASAAGIIAKLGAIFGLYALLATAPIIAIVYFTYCTYLKNVEASTKQAELAREHALEVQQHMEALRESEERFRSAFDYATIGMAVVSTEGRWVQVNRSLCDIFGYTEAELLDADFRHITHRQDLASVDEQFQQLVLGHTSSHQTEVRYLHRQGREVWSHLGMSVVRDGPGRPLHVIFQIQDITDRKRAEE
jgi:PAS domain S-box-containing protein